MIGCEDYSVINQSIAYIEMLSLQWCFIKSLNQQKITINTVEILIVWTYGNISNTL